MTMIPSKNLYIIPIIIIIGALCLLFFGIKREVYMLNHDLLEIKIEEEFYYPVRRDQELIFLSKETDITFSDFDNRRGNVLLHMDVDGINESFIFRIDEVEDKLERYEITMLLDDDYQVGDYHSLFKVKFLDNNDYEFYTRASESYENPTLVLDNTDKSEEIFDIIAYIVMSIVLFIISYVIYKKIYTVRTKRINYINSKNMRWLVFYSIKQKIDNCRFFL